MNLETLTTALIYPAAMAAVIAFILSPVVIAWYRRNNWLDDPKNHTHAKVVHTKAVPRGGGLVVYFAILTAFSVFGHFDKASIGIFIGGAVLALTGFIDDIKDLNPYGRLLINLFAASCVVGAGVGIAFITNPLAEGVIHLNHPQIQFYFLGKIRSIWILADIFGLLWIVWLMNMINWSKGLDGQLPGIVVIAGIVIALLSFKFTEDVTQWDVAILGSIVAGAFLGFLPWNVFPQKMMPGYGGGSLAGFFLAVLSILSGAKLATLILVLAIPMLDAVFVILLRIKEGKSPVWGDRNHLHHKLLDLGASKPQIALFYWLMSLVFGILALQLNAQQKAYTIVMLALLIIGTLTWLHLLSKSSKRSAQDNGLRT